MNKLEALKILLNAIFFEKELLFSKYDNLFNNYIYQDAKKLYENNVLTEIVLDDLVEKLNLKKKPEVEINFFNEYRDGSVNNHELEVITKLTNILNPDKILEIGTNLGRTTYNLSKNTKDDCEIYTMNLPENICSFEVGKLFKNTEYAKKIKQIFSDSTKYNFSQLPLFDFIFIDGNHKYNFVKQDSNNALTRLNDKGIIIWDDIDRCHLGGTKAVYEFCQENDFELYLISGADAAIGWKRG